MHGHNYILCCLSHFGSVLQNVGSIRVNGYLLVPRKHASVFVYEEKPLFWATPHPAKKCTHPYAGDFFLDYKERFVLQKVCFTATQGVSWYLSGGAFRTILVFLDNGHGCKTLF